jgi:beta-fructofuranosidase
MGFTTSELRQRRESLADDRFRPLYHFSSPTGTLHDPGGFGYWQGNYHLFYIGEGGKGHAVSEDMVHWRDLPTIPALGGMTGQMVTTDEAALMSVGRAEGVFVATSEDPMLLEWDRRLILPKETLLQDYQMPIDTCFWHEDEEWLLLLRKHHWEQGLWHFKGNRPTLGLFASTDLRNWREEKTFYVKTNAIQPGDDLACPNFLPIGQDRHLLLHYCHARGPMYTIGVYNQQQREFAAEHHGQFSFGHTKHGSLHAPSAFVNSAGRLISLFNITENRPHDRDWVGIMSLPRVVGLHADYTKPLSRDTPLDVDNTRNFFNPLLIEPVAELKSLRFNPVELKRRPIPANQITPLPEVRGRAMELEVQIEPKEAREVELHVWRSPDGAETTVIRLYMQGHARSTKARTLCIDVSDASLDPQVRSRVPEAGPLWLEPDEPLRLRVFLDRSVVEVFANQRQCLTVRAYPSRTDSTGIAVCAKGGDAELVSLKAWHMRSIWPELECYEGE